jgi:hypothetical protein
MRHAVGFMGAVAVAMTATAAIAAPPTRQLITVEPGGSTTVAGLKLDAAETSIALVSLSSEFAAVAVISGRIASGKQAARAGEALVAPLDGGRIRRFGFDARRLAATMPAEWAATTAAPLQAIARRQQRQRFWGRIEPVSINAGAPAAPELEGVRQSYLANPTVAGLRRAAAKDPVKLASLTATRFAAALAAGDAATLADLIDPKPFTDTGADTAAWQAARAAFAGKLAADAALQGAMASAPTPVADDQTAFDAGGYRIRVTPRDRAMFVTAVEAVR